ncbi:MAG: patatin-like phospholipase family protein [Candidatus Obscuribacterales bacterium]|nr:patatin-like phospholipase family protein [Candidatus Obscuribacterales bacterium]
MQSRVLSHLIYRSVLALYIALCLISASVTNSAQAADTTHSGTVVKHPKIGLALGGGGARGAAHVGVLHILEQHGVPIDYIAGTNVGAVVGGLYSAGVSISSLKEMFTRGTLMRAYLNVPLKLRLMGIPLVSTSRLLGHKSFDGLYRGEKFKSFLNKYVPESERDLEDLKIPFGAVTYDLIEGEVKVLRKGNLGAVLQASSAIPVLRKPVKLGTDADPLLCIDGGVAVNIPVKEVREMGADIVIAVDLNDNARGSKLEEYYKPGSVSHRVIQAHLRSIDRGQLDNADIVIKPNVDHMGLMSRQPELAKRAIVEGETATMERWEQISKLLQK